jgi:hypothetical protein
MTPATTKTTILERTIMTKRPLQFMKITPKLQCWISFDSSDGKLHHCPARPLALEVKKLIQTAISQMTPAAGSHNIHTQYITNLEFIHRIDRIIDDLEFIRQQYLTSH